MGGGVTLYSPLFPHAVRFDLIPPATEPGDFFGDLVVTHEDTNRVIMLWGFQKVQTFLSD